MLMDSLKMFETGDLPRKKQPEGDFAKCKLIRDKELFIDFNRSAKEIERFIRALNPFLIANTNFRRTITRIFAAEAIDKHNKSAEPGEIVKIDRDRFFIATGKGLIAPTVLQFGSFFTGTAKDFIHIVNPKTGEKFL